MYNILNRCKELILDYLSSEELFVMLEATIALCTALSFSLDNILHNYKLIILFRFTWMVGESL